MLLHLYAYVCLFGSVWLGEHCLDNQQCGSCRRDTRKCTTGCFDGYFGSMCDMRCSPNCRNKRCKMTSKGIEECTEGCNPGYYGTRCGLVCDTPEENCEKCSGGCESGFCQFDSKCFSNCSGSYFGRACKPCTGECDDCNKITGVCQGCTNCLDRNCSEGCKEGCRTGYYEKKCETKCSEHCLLGCHQESGHCKSCKVGWYGPFCDLRCSTGCLDSCIRNGSCVNGCLRGLYGEKCNRTCPANCFNERCQRDGSCNLCMIGFFGKECNMICEKCDGVCDITTGTCRNCKQLYTGSDCQLDCRQNCSVPGCEAFALCKTEKGNGSFENYVPYFVVGVMVLAVVTLSAYVIRRLRRMNVLVYDGVERCQQCPDPNIDSENHLYTEVTHPYHEVNEDEINIDNHRPLPHPVVVRDSSSVQKGGRLLEPNPHPDTGISSTPIAGIDPFPHPHPDPESDQDQNHPIILECNVSFSSGNDTSMVSDKPSRIYHSQYLTCVPEFNRQNCHACSHDAACPFYKGEGTDAKFRYQTI